MKHYIDIPSKDLHLTFKRRKAAKSWLTQWCICTINGGDGDCEIWIDGKHTTALDVRFDGVWHGGCGWQD